VIKNKKVILSFLFLAWSIIFAHSIVPHHHHFELISAQKGHCCHEHNDHHEGHDHHQDDYSVTTEFDFCDHNESNHTCHFHVDVLTKVSVDNFFILKQEKELYDDLNCIETNNYIYYKEFVSDKIPKTEHLRGPPQLV
jgi:hypothetical protein